MKKLSVFGLAILIIVMVSTTVYFTVFAGDIEDTKLTYVSSTEYIAFDEAQVIVRLSNFVGQPIILATCTDNVLYPNKTIWMSGTSMSVNSENNYYHSFTIPQVTGVYETIVTCTLLSGRNISQAKTFHVSMFSDRVFALFAGLNQTINDNQLETVTLIQDFNGTMVQGFQDTITRVNETYADLSSEIAEVRNEVQDNFTTVIDLINALNTSIAEGENASHTEIIELLSIINTTTVDTQTQLTTFENTTQSNFESVNATILEVKQDTEYIIEIVEGINQTTHDQYINVTTLIGDLTTTVNNNFDITQQNITELKDLILDLNFTVTEQYDNVSEAIYQFWTETNFNFDILYNLTNLTEWEVSLILDYLNITTTDLRIFVTHNNCILGSTYIIDAQVLNYFNWVMTDTNVWCNISTNFWGNDTMTYTPSVQSFRYTHTCDPLGIVEWEIECDWI